MKGIIFFSVRHSKPILIQIQLLNIFLAFVLSNRIDVSAIMERKEVHSFLNLQKIVFPWNEVMLA